MKKSLIFDLDGTMLESMSVWDNIGADYLTSKNILNIPLDLKETLKPMSLIDAANYFVNQFNIDLSPQEICDEINIGIENKYRYDVQLKDGVLEFLKNNKDNDMCIATATDRHLVESALSRLDILKYFKFIITSTEVGNSKLSPDIFLQAAKGLGADVCDCIVFEDALHAIKTANLAGFYTIGVYENCFERDMSEIKNTADEFVYSLSEVIL